MGRESTSKQAYEFFESLWLQGDPWELESSSFEQQKYDRLLALLDGRRYRQALEIGCGAGVFTRQLSRLADRIVAVDISPAAIERARMAGKPDPCGIIDYRVANVMEYDVRTEGPWDLVVINETIYYLGWLYSFFDVGWLASELYRGLHPDGRLLMANTEGGCDDALLSPWLIRSYRDLFINVGFRSELEDAFGGTKHGSELKVLFTLFQKGGTEGDFADACHER